LAIWLAESSIPLNALLALAADRYMQANKSESLKIKQS
jgi:hypothetical protein